MRKEAKPVGEWNFSTEVDYDNLYSRCGHAPLQCPLFLSPATSGTRNLSLARRMAIRLRSTFGGVAVERLRGAQGVQSCQLVEIATVACHVTEHSSTLLCSTYGAIQYASP